MPRELLEKINYPDREITEIDQQIRAEAREGGLWGCENEHPAEQKQVHQINHYERKKCSLVAEVGLILRDHPAREREMKSPRGADYCIEQSPVRLHV